MHLSTKTNMTLLRVMDETRRPTPTTDTEEHHTNLDPKKLVEPLDLSTTLTKSQFEYIYKGFRRFLQREGQQVLTRHQFKILFALTPSDLKAQEMLDELVRVYLTDLSSIQV